MKRLPLLLFLVTLLAVGLACNAVVPAANSEPAANTDEIVGLAVATIEAQMDKRVDTPINSPSVALDENLEQRIIDIYQQVNPAVVYILTEHASVNLGTGSGFLYNEEGYIVTNNHVVTAGDAYEVVFADGTRSLAELVGTDVDSDLAVIRVDTVPDGVQPVPLGEQEQIRVGQFVVAIGNPFGQQGSISMGIVSALGRRIESQRVAPDQGQFSLPEVIQTDAPINPGNSGGPLLNLQGEVIGVNNMIRSATGVNSGVGFAVPVAAVRRIVPALIENGEYTYPYIGIGTPPFELTLEQWEELGLPATGGVYITSVTAGSPADEAGVRAAPDESLAELESGGDLITAIDDQEVREFHDLISYLTFHTEVGQTVELTIVRDGEVIQLPLTLGERP